MPSIANKPTVIARQKFHRPCRQLRLKLSTLNTYVAHYDSKNRKSIFWLDYTKLKYAYFQDFEALLAKVAVNSVIKVTLRAHWQDHQTASEIDAFKAQFG